VKTSTRGEVAELFSLFSSFDGACQSGSFLIQRNRDKRSTRKLDVGVFTQPGSKADLVVAKSNFRFTPHSGHPADTKASPLSGDIVAKVFLGWRTKILRAADAFYARRREGPYRFIQNRSRTSVVALKSNAAAEKSKDQLSRDF
jgi:hypothetical protein